jgi:hypothetical protein
MLGNMYVHCSDRYANGTGIITKYDGVSYASGPAVDPTGPPPPGPNDPWWSKMHVVRGSGWHMRGAGKASTCRSASRERGPGTDQSTGFRVVVEAK